MQSPAIIGPAQPDPLFSTTLADALALDIERNNLQRQFNAHEDYLAYLSIGGTQQSISRHCTLAFSVNFKNNGFHYAGKLDITAISWPSWIFMRIVYQAFKARNKEDEPRAEGQACMKLTKY